MWKEGLSQKLTIVCYKEGSSEICGLNCLDMNFKSVPLGGHENQAKGKGARDISVVFDFLKKKADVYNRYNVDQYLHGLGLLTLPKYRGCGIGTELLKARIPLMKALGLTLTGTVFSAPGSQGAARKAGFSEDVVIPYETLGKEEPFIEFPNITWPVVKFMCYHLNCVKVRKKMKWERPDSVAFPQIWWRFSAKDPVSGQIVNYRIEDLTEDRYDEVAGLMVEHFVAGEPMSISLGTINDKESLKKMRHMYKEIMDKKLSIVCYKENSNEICGFNLLEILFRAEDEIQQNQLENKRKIAVVFEILKKKADVYNRYSVDKYVFGRGLLTLPKYRGCGIATELLKARIPFMKALGFTLTGTVFSAPGSQGAAKKAGYTEDVVMTYESFAKEKPFIEFPNISWPFIIKRYAAAKIVIV
uniref:N-acetyltransferase domain-containing protein n=1 Tax=Lutzomyia longipalpis TaxID=7200 RepID=A0A1B0GHD5_LUTLO